MVEKEDARGRERKRMETKKRVPSTFAFVKWSDEG